MGMSHPPGVLRGQGRYQQIGIHTSVRKMGSILVHPVRERAQPVLDAALEHQEEDQKHDQHDPHRDRPYNYDYGSALRSAKFQRGTI